MTAISKRNFCQKTWTYVVDVVVESGRLELLELAVVVVSGYVGGETVWSTLIAATCRESAWACDKVFLCEGLSSP